VVKESGLRAVVPVGRFNGADGHVGVKWRTKDITAKEGKDYVASSGELVFDNQEVSKTLEIVLKESDVSLCKFMLYVNVVFL
jgi:hypothetical protein